MDSEANVKVEANESNDEEEEEEAMMELDNNGDVKAEEENGQKSEAKSKNICLQCGLEVTSNGELIEHINKNVACMNHYGPEGLDELKSQTFKLIDANYQEDENSACAPVVEDCCSKLDHSKPELIRTLSSDHFLSPKIYGLGYNETIDAFIGMTLSNDGESIEVRTLIHRQNMHNLSKLMDLFHAIMAVMDADLCSLTMFKLSPFVLNSTGQNLACLRNKYTNELVESDRKMPDPPETTCIPDTTRETKFLSENMACTVPYQQLLLNTFLDFRDMAAIGVKVKKGSKYELRPLFSVNMSEDYVAGMKNLGTILTSWYGSKEILNEYFCKLPCFVSVSNRYIYETYLDCLENLRKPLVTTACKFCGLEFKYNSYLFKEKGKFKHHESSHDLQCKKCGLICESFAAKIYHNRTHKKNNFPCEQCKFIGSSQRSLDSHIKYKHIEAMCELCGKSFSCGATLDIHKNAIHKPRLPRDQQKKYFCHICGNSFCSKQVLKKHLFKHSNEDSLVNKYMAEDPSEYKFMCTRHDNCKKYFKKADYLRKHINQYGDKPYPHFVHEQYIPVIPEGQKMITDQDKEFLHAAEKEEWKAKRKICEVTKQFLKKDPVPGAGTVVAKIANLPKSQMGTGAFACHLCNKSYEKKITLEKHLESHSRKDSTVNRIMNEDPTEYKYMCTRHNNCKKYFKQARYLRNHLKKFAKIPYPENATSHYMPDFKPDQVFVTDQDPEFLHILAREDNAAEHNDDSSADEQNEQNTAADYVKKMYLSS